MPPTAAQRCHRLRHTLLGTKTKQLSVDRFTTPPLLELEGTQPAPYPLVQSSPDSRYLRQAKVAFPSRQVAAELFDHLGEAAPAIAASTLPDPLLERLQRFLRYATAHLAIAVLPQAVAEEAAPKHARHCAFRFVDLQA